jgi:C-terminal processing protease CtpA/Prc
MMPAQTDTPDKVIDAVTRSAVIDAALDKLQNLYVFPDVAKKMDEAIRLRQKRREYDSVTSGRRFAELLAEHLREVSQDNHLRVNFSANPIPDRPESALSPEDKERLRREMGDTNCAFEKLEHLSGNVGYLKFNAFRPPEICGETAVAAMNFLSNSDALIVDLRENGGGAPAMIAFITSYLFSEPVHLNDIYDRGKDSTHQWWTLPYVPGRRLADKPVYVLTSSLTFSGAEEFCYNLKNLKRATIIGEVTRGGAHPTAWHRIHPHFRISVPFARAINPISKTNWEGKGVEPDVKVKKEIAFETAHKMALELRAPTVTDLRRRELMQNQIDRLKKEITSKTN